MEMLTDSVFFLVGPTASGKTSIARLLAARTGARIVSADSMNVYRGMDIGTAKPTSAERGAVEYAGIDLVDPTEPFSVADWLAAVKPAFSHGGEVIVTGGTGLYVKCLLQGLDDLPAADKTFRIRAEKMTLTELQAEAHSADPEGYAVLADKQNPRRLIRLIEQGDRVTRNWSKELPTVIGLHVEREVLRKRIVTRVEQMYANGLLEEARGLMGRKLSITAEKAIGYAEAFSVLRGECTEAEGKERTVVRTRRLAKRQMTWFHHQLNVHWIETDETDSAEKRADAVFEAWQTLGPSPVQGWGDNR